MRDKNLIFFMALCFCLPFVSCSPPGGGGPGEMISIVGGTFTQDGSASFEHTVSDFMLARYEVRYSLWYDVRVWATEHGYTFAHDGWEGNDDTSEGNPPTAGNDEPVTSISWCDAVVWCNAYSERKDLNPVYYTDGLFNTPIKDATNVAECTGAVPNWAANGYRLPTEGEWQYAASNKGLTPWQYASGADDDVTNATETKLVAWYSDNASETQDVGTTTKSSALSMWDLSGNVSEWCWDWLGAYPAGPEIDYRGPASGADKILRGGSYLSVVNSLRVGNRDSIEPDLLGPVIGFRLARTK